MQILDLDQNCLVFLVRALEVSYLVIAFEVPYSRGHFVDQIFVMGNQENRPLITLQSDVERIDRLEIQVIRRLVKNKNVRFLQHELTEEQPEIGRASCRERVKSSERDATRQ